MTDSPRILKPFECHVAELDGTTDTQRFGTCPFCLKDNHFYVNVETGCWDCKACGEDGNLYIFLAKIAEQAHAHTRAEAWQKLARLRRLPVEALKPWGLGWNGSAWLIPVRANTGHVYDIRRWSPNTKTMKSTPGCRTQLLGVDRLAKAKPGTIVWVCEGEWDAMALGYVLTGARGRGGEVVVAVPGAAIFKEPWVKHFRGMHVRLCYDADKAGDKGTKKAVRMLSPAAKDIQRVVWPQDVPEGYDVRDFIVELRRKHKLRKPIIRRLDRLLKLVEPVAVGTSAENQHGEPSDPHVLAEKSIHKHFTAAGGELMLRFHRGLWWSWADGRYVQQLFDDVRAVTNQRLRILLNENQMVNKRVSPTLVITVLRALEGMCLVPHTSDMPTWLGDKEPLGSGNLLAMENGLLDMGILLDQKKAELHPHTPLWFSSTKLPYPYLESCGCPRWTKFLKRVLPDRKARRLLQEFLGYCLVYDTSRHKFLILYGEGANGKSVVTTVARNLLGPENVSAVGIERFGDQFAMAPTIGKLANIVDEIGPVRGVAENILKAVVSGDTIQVEFKYQTSFTAKPTARLIFATNELPRFDDRSSGMWRRIIILPFEVRIPEHEQDLHLADKICEHELPAIFRWAVRGLRRLQSNGKFTLSEASRGSIDAHRRESNPAREFLEDKYVEDPDGQVHCGTLFEMYLLWCVDQHIMTLTASQFGREVKRVFPHALRKQIHDGQKRRYLYTGITSIAAQRREARKAKRNRAKKKGTARRRAGT